MITFNAQKITTLLSCLLLSTFSFLATAQCDIIAGFSANSYACGAISETFTNTSTSSNPMNFNWLVDGVSQGNSTDLLYTFPAEGTYVIELEVTDPFDATCLEIASITYYVFHQPDAAFSYALASSNQVNFTHTNSGPAGISYIYAWDFDGDGAYDSTAANPSYTFASVGVYTACLTVEETTGGLFGIPNCVDTYCDVINIGGVCDVASSFTADAYGFPCVGIPETYTNTSTSANAITYEWFLDGVSQGTATDLTLTYAAIGTYTVDLIATDALDATCTSSTTFTVTVSEQPDPSFTYSFNTANEVVFVPVDASLSPNPYFYSWDLLGDGAYDSYDVSPTFAYPTSGTYTACLTINNGDAALGLPGCPITQCETITISGVCDVAAGFTATNNYQCGPTSETFTNTTTSSTAVAYEWLVDGVSQGTSTDLTYTFAAAGAYIIELVATDIADATCTNIASITHYVLHQPDASFSYTFSSANQVNFTHNNPAPAGASYTYGWDMLGDGTFHSTSANPTYIFPADGTYTVCLYVEEVNGGLLGIPNCSDSYCENITITGGGSVCDIAADFTALNFGNLCAGMQEDFTNTSTSTNTMAFEWFVDNVFQAATTDFSYTFTTVGSYTVDLLATDPADPTCSNIQSFIVTVWEQPDAAFTYSFNAANEVVFTPTNPDPTGGMFIYSWDFLGDGAYDSYASNPTFTYPANGTYSVCLTVDNGDPAAGILGCPDTHCETITISNVCDVVAGFTSNNSTFICNATNTATLVNTSTGSNGLVYEWLVDGVVVGTSIDLTYNFPGVGNYVVDLLVRDATDATCSDLSTMIIFVEEAPDATFTYTTNATGLTVFTITNPAPAGATYSWDFGDGTGSNVASPTIILPLGIIQNVCLTISNDSAFGIPCDDTYCQNVGLGCLANAYVDSDMGIVDMGLLICENTAVNFTAANVPVGASTDWEINGVSVGSGTGFDLALSPIFPLGTHVVSLTVYPDATDPTCFDTFTFNVIADDNSCVWPGDVNWDNIVNMDDLLDFGLVPLATTGAARQYATANPPFDWVAQACADWTGTQGNGVNEKHVDCDGDGITDIVDAQAIIDNFGLSHNGNAPKLMSLPTNAALTVTPVDINDYTNDGIVDSIFFDIALDDSLDTAISLDAYGIRFKATYNPFFAGGNVINAETWFDNSWLGNNNMDMIGLFKNYQSSGELYIGMTRIDQEDTSGSGTICRVGCILDIDVLGMAMGAMRMSSTAVAGYEPFTLSLSAIKLITADGSPYHLEDYEITVWLQTVPAVEVLTSVILQGAYNPTTELMNTTLRNNGLLPLSQPFNTAPWFYTGNEGLLSMDAIPTDVVDWVLLEMRDANDYDAIIEQQIGFLLADGTIVDIYDSTSGVKFFNIYDTESYYVTIRHRNHLAAMSASPIEVQASILGYDFTSSNTQAMGTQQLVAVAPNVYGLYCGDMNADGVFTLNDFNLYANYTINPNQYALPDANLDGNITIADFNLYQSNSSVIGISPIRY